MVSFCAELEDGAAEQVELDGHLGSHGRINDGGQLVRGENTEWVVPEVQHGNKLVVANSLQPPQSELPLLRQAGQDLDFISSGQERLGWKGCRTVNGNGCFNNAGTY